MPLSGGTPDHAAVGAALFILGGKDHLMPALSDPLECQEVAQLRGVTETYEFPERSQFTGVEPGWEQVAD